MSQDYAPGTGKEGSAQSPAPLLLLEQLHKAIRVVRPGLLRKVWEWLNEDLTQVEWCLQGVSYPPRPLPKSSHTSHPPASTFFLLLTLAQEAEDSFRRLYLVKAAITVSDFTVKTLQQRG